MAGQWGPILRHSVLRVCMALLTACATTPADKPPTTLAKAALKQAAPAFTATDLSGRSFRLADYRGKNLVLVFYIGHQCKTCVQQLAELQKHLAELRALQTEVIAFASRSWQDVQTTQRVLGLTFVLVPGPQVELLIQYGAYNANTGVAQPTTLIVDKAGLIRWRSTGKDANDYPRYTAILAQLQRLP